MLFSCPQRIRCWLAQVYRLSICLTGSLVTIKRGFQPTPRTQRKERNEMTSLLDRPITAASDDGVTRCQAVADTRHKI